MQIQRFPSVDEKLLVEFDSNDVRILMDAIKYALHKRVDDCSFRDVNSLFGMLTDFDYVCDIVNRIDKPL